MFVTAAYECGPGVGGVTMTVGIVVVSVVTGSGVVGVWVTVPWWGGGMWSIGGGVQGGMVGELVRVVCVEVFLLRNFLFLVVCRPDPFRRMPY